nr:reverse transcriptase domain-containing protein [Tanacetum cinerariifolium]
RETVGTTVVQKSGIQCYNCKEYGHVARECQKPKREKDAAYQKDKMLLYAVDNSGPIFDSEPLQKVSNNDNYNVFAIESEHPEQSKSINDTYLIEQVEHNVIIDSLDMSYDREQVDQDDDDDLANERLEPPLEFQRIWYVEGHVRSEVISSDGIKRQSDKGCQLVDSLIILEALIEGFLVRRIYVDGGSSSEVMYEHCFQNLRSKTKAKLKESRTPLVGFYGEVSYPIEPITLSVTVGEPERLQTIPMEFAVVRSHSPYNVILGRTGLRSLGAVASTIHSMIKFPTANRIETMTTKRETLQEFQRMEEARGPAMKERITFPQTQACDAKETTNRGMEESPWPPKKVVIHDDYPHQTIIIGGNLSAECRSGLVEILRKHVDAFAWTPADMTEIPRFITEHELKTYPYIKLRVQRKRSIALDIRKTVKDEVAEWIKAGIVRKGMNIIGPLLEAPGKIKFLIVAVDYFTKWIETKAVTSITGKYVKNFVFDNVVCRFRILATIITDNGTQLINDPFKSWAEGLGIKLVSTLVYHPQENGAMERANRSIMQEIKTRLHPEEEHG